MIVKGVQEKSEWIKRWNPLKYENVKFWRIYINKKDKRIKRSADYWLYGKWNIFAKYVKLKRFVLRKCEF